MAGEVKLQSKREEDLSALAVSEARHAVNEATAPSPGATADFGSSSFSFNVERRTQPEPNPERVRSVPHMIGAARPMKSTQQVGMRKLPSPFAGKTILDKLVSFVAYLIKRLELMLFNRETVKTQPKVQAARVTSAPATEDLLVNRVAQSRKARLLELLSLRWLRSTDE